MCGIVAELQVQPGSGLPEAGFRELVDLAARRGPDAHGYWTDPGVCQLGFRRLSILDLSDAANQPMVAGDDRYALVYNGELYNYRELRDGLEQAGVAFHTSGDTEVVLHALVRWGRAALDRFNGMFALAFYDTTRQSMLLARDHAGIKPLYFLHTKQGVVAASQYDQILEHPWRQGCRISQDGLALYLRVGYVPAPYGILEHTHMVEPGEWHEFTATGEHSQGHYYRFPAYQAADLQGEEAFEAVDAAITSAVRRQMVSDVPLGTFLSGGVDSPLVAAKSALVGDSPPKAFTIGQADSALDESADARRYAELLGLPHIVDQYTPEKALDWLDVAVTACSEPLADMSIFPTLLVSCLARREVTVMLSGDGGDELFWGYPERFGPPVAQSTRFQEAYWRRRGRWLAGRVTSGANGDLSLRWPTIGDWHRAAHTRLSDPYLRNVLDDAPAWPATFNEFRYAGYQQDETAQWLRWNEFVGHLTRVLLKVDRASMYHSLEVRVPLLDREVIDVAQRVDWRSCMDLERNIGKLPLRRALAQHVGPPPTAKRGFGVPMADWLRGPLLPAFYDMVVSRDDVLGVPVRRAGMEGMVADHVAGRADYSRWMWTILSLALWNERYLEA